jgi:hypothetical protein
VKIKRVWGGARRKKPPILFGGFSENMNFLVFLGWDGMVFALGRCLDLDGVWTWTVFGLGHCLDLDIKDQDFSLGLDDFSLRLDELKLTRF